MNEQQIKMAVVLNLAFWGVAILFPIVLKLIQTGSGAPPKIFEVLIPLFQFMLAGGATYLLKSYVSKVTTS